MFELLGKVFLKLIGGSRNDRLIRARMKFVVEKVNPLEPEMRALSDEEMLSRSRRLRDRLAGGESREDVKAEAFALTREASRRARNHRQFDVQLAAGMVLDDGWVAEEATGEGKTIACYPAIYMAVLAGMKAHVVTVNDYLVQRDAEFAAPIFEMLGVTVGYITAEMGTAGPEGEPRREAYACDVTYGTNSEFGFDYLRDNMKNSVADQMQGALDFAIIDEVDSILIDEARTPLIISGPAYGQTERFAKADKVARELIGRNRPWDRANQRVESLKREMKALDGEKSKARGEAAAKIGKRIAEVDDQLTEAEEELAQEEKYYEVELDKKSVHMTHEGVSVAQEIAGIGSFYVGANMEWPHLMDNALRAHLVYEKDKEYVVQQGKVIIVDEFTGRLLEGREWSDGLHQAVDARERVPIKEENQTLATITLQNYFNLYKKLAGMTGTAMTEAGEFMKIYKLDVASVPTHRPVNRRDQNDRIYGTVDAKYDALVEEINTVSKLPRPVLVGTTSVEKSEVISEMLTRRYGVEHSVLNARPENAGREADIVLNAGQLHPLKKGSKQMVGTVTIATNMAGRGTDIKLGEGVVYEKCRVLSPEELQRLGVEVEALFPAGSNKCCIHCPQYDAATSCAHCFKPKVDPAFPARGRGECCEETPCGLHIVGTERHEARRIDNQLRGRSGRQGDPGSSRFFLSLRDDLMAIFAGEWTLKVLGWLGLQGDMAIEDRRVSKGIERAQKKVEERNFEIRKNLLEYDEVMNHQRRIFYSRRQQILEGRDLQEQVQEMLRETVAESAGSYLDGQYSQRCIAEWAGKTLQIQVRPERVRAETPEELPSLEGDLRSLAKEEAAGVISVTLGEYMDAEADRRDWDLRGLSGWAMSRFGVGLSQNQLRKMEPPEVEQALYDGACEKIDQINLSPLGHYLEADLARESLAEWARSKFGIEVTASELQGQTEDVEQVLLAKVEAAYQRREIEYPVEYAMDMTVGTTGTDNVYAVGALVDWANRKFDPNLTVEDFRDRKPDVIYDRLVGFSEAYLAGGGLEDEIRRKVGSAPAPEAAEEFAAKRFDSQLVAEDLDGDAFGRLLEVGREFLRREMTELERFVLLQIYDSSWKDHLLAMDHLKSGIGLRGFAEQDPRVAYKREGATLFQEMLAGVQEKVTDMIFKVRLTAGQEIASVYEVSNVVHEQLQGYDHLAQDMADQAAAAAPQKVQTIRRNVPRVGRNDPCPCGSGKKYKKCCGKVA
ncbi:MAG TPA: preprotein translocase subunit SecA [Phycisphaerae bacterium]|nr:preprotein translocase subunit SecA [Phycisphaerae bacterium]